ncbi:Metal-dependent hydrolase, endonuclease/exonuclease/phosphatase family [Natronincola peptidivorans]|uniref:Metal-dependent hydrolase, endonuclease/exonuclease/phosphatase family n=1 Tax=Natronincola peptidivorans TaxID=426128 RepID=A0A1I0E8G6_9FIRM|nr:endonuclease/exonuclease/phosphatase family protein [Natronincola peptidivorans]SET41467.1 Metal-dependent hydrolase, endonuclease/exonuclease/phosphatase family [Natronincola peptidivorans]
MVKNRNVFIIFTLALFFLLGFTLQINTSATGEIKAVKYIQSGMVSHIEIITDRNMEKIILEGFDSEGEMTHFLKLEDYVTKNNPELNRNIFYITNKVQAIEKIQELILINGGNIRLPIEIQEIEVDSNLQTMEYTMDKGSVNTLKIMSYNVHHGRNLYGRYSLDEIAEVIRTSDADIIGLQELDNGVVRSRFQDQIKYLSEKLSMEYVYGYNFNLLGGMYGNGILSKYPIESYENLYLPSGREQRGLLSAVINVEGKQLNFLVTHLGLNQQERKGQVNTISKYLETLPHQKILVGDLNARPNSEEVQLLSKELLDTAHAVGKDAEPTFDLPVLSGRIDYIFLDHKIQLKDYNVIKSRASDHYPITATIELE